MDFIIEIIDNPNSDTALYVYDYWGTLTTVVGNAKTLAEAYSFKYSSIDSIEKLKAVIGKNIECIFKEMHDQSNKVIHVNIVKVDLENKIISKRIEIVKSYCVINSDGELILITDVVR
ncbi:hypothetical protein [Pseudomonas aeruginosa]|uniref:hypothetical protein n=1 Tax=Pseudomonas aeruginosa TaxID=287 RepID=UPI001CA58D95|nr:hypothetical protein [Pseudomonas aeruginosa]MBW6070883.1 hypothetical protein [Pseudomonas aeruginosa]USL86558.1 hypothetical protein CDGHABPJ_00094 [Pseudomonas phage OMKO1]WNV48005.1 hypothetical protein [Pseudomonas phage fMGyn-Pae01]